MIELVLVVVVLGILAAFSIPRLDRDLEQESADNVLSAIRYTQHLALIDNKHEFDDKRWQRRFWRIMFAQCSDGTDFYRIGSDDDKDSTSTFEESEAAIDPSNGKPIYMSNNGDCTATDFSDNILIGKKYGMTVNNGSGGCTGKSIGFDHLGRPHVGFSASDKPNNASYMSSECLFNFTMSDSTTFQISIQPETGYAQIIRPNP